MKLLSIVVPCLNESETLGICLEKINKAMLVEKEVNYELIMVDNGSTDNSKEIAIKYNATVIEEKEKGYGSALRSGIRFAKGDYIIFADADDSYDFYDLKKFIQKAKEGFELINGCRFKKAGGKIEKGAMPFSHQYIGNPLFTFMTKLFFKIKFNDVYCGFRMFKKSVYEKNFFFSSGMEFAVEHLIKINNSSSKVVEIPITLHKDKRKKSKSHLNTIIDGFKTLKFLLIYGAQFPLALITFFSLVLSVVTLNSFILSDESDYFKNAFYFFTSTAITIQFFFFYLYSSLASRYLGLKKSNAIYKILTFLTLKKAIYLFLFFLILSLINIYDYFFINFIDKEISLVLGTGLFLISLQVILNSLIVSVLELFKFKKNGYY